MDKFYNSMYRKTPYLSESSPPVKGIRLWSDWNNGIRKWAEKQVKETKHDTDKTFQYLRVRTEDIVSDDVSVKFRAMKKLATFVGSGHPHHINDYHAILTRCNETDLSDDAICCLATEGSTFLGSHDRVLTCI